MRPDALLRARLEAGALLAPDVALPADLSTDTVDARAFSHPALPGRTVVRLVPDVLAEGVIAEMGELGFVVSGHEDNIARQRRRGRSFPGAAIQAAPGSAGALLALMPAFRAEARRAQQKPGHARDAYNAMGEALARSTPAALPSFYEEVGRVFIESGNLAFAASAFDKARQAEAAHNLPRDLAVEADCWLEFAAAGALSVKAVTSYPKVLAGSPDGWARFVALCARRSEAGLAPWASFDKDLRAAARLLGRDPARDVAALYAALMGTPGLKKATVEQWALMAPAFQEAIAAEPGRARALLELVPEPPKVPDDWEARWRALLESVGALPALRAGQLAAGVASATLTRWIVAFDDASDGTFDLFLSLLPRLREEGLPLVLDREDWGEGAAVDADLLERCLAEGLVVAPFHEDSSIDCAPWVQRVGAEAPDRFGRGAGLPQIEAHPAFAALLPAGLLREKSASGELERALLRFPSLAVPYVDWLRSKIEALGALPLGALIAAVGALDGVIGPDAWPLAPGLKERLAEARVAVALRRTLQGGIFAELGWPAFEAAVAELGDAVEDDVMGPPQVALLRAGMSVRAVGAAGEVGRFDLNLGKVQRIRALVWSAGQLLVTWYDGDWNLHGQWTGEGVPFEDASLGEAPTEPDHAIALPDGRFSYGGAALTPGARVLGACAPLFTDGVRSWIGKIPPKAAEYVLHRFDPESGAVGEPDEPAFFAGFGRPDAAVDLGDCHLTLLPAGSALIGAEGLFGLRRRRPAAERAEDLVGNAHEGRLSSEEDAEKPVGFVSLPGQPRPLALSTSNEWGGPQRSCFALWLDGQLLDFGGKTTASGWAVTPPARFFANLSVRDAAGSLALRAISEEAIDALLSAAKADRAALPEGEEELTAQPATEAALAAHLPAVSHPALRKGLAQLLDRAVLADKALSAFVTGAKGESEEEEESESADGDQRYHGALGFLADTIYYPTGELGAELSGLERLLAEGAVAKVWSAEGEPSEYPWTRWLPHLPALVWRAIAPGVEPEARTLLLDLVERLAGLPLFGEAATAQLLVVTFPDSLSPFVRIEVDEDDPAPTDDGDRSVRAAWADGHHRRLVRRLSDSYDRPVRLAVIEPRSEALGPFPGSSSVERLNIPASGESLLAFVAAARAGGALAMDPVAIERFAAISQLNPAEAAFVYAGLPERRSYGADPLGKARREALGLKRDAYRLARDAWRAVESERLIEAFGLALPADPARLYTATPAEADHPAALLGAAVLATFGARLVLPPELLQLADREVDLDAEALGRLIAPAGWAPWTTPTVGRLDADGDLITESGDGELDEALPALVRGLIWLAYRTPGDSPLRAGLSTCMGHLKARLADPERLLSLSMAYLGDAKEKKRGRALFEALGGELVEPPGRREGNTARCRDNGRVVAVMDDDQIAFAFRPARFTEADLPELRRITAFTEEAETLNAFVLARSAGLAALCAPVGAGWAQDPRRSAPETVAAVSARLGLVELAAAHYLMLLALPDPTDKNLALWTGLKPAELKRSGAELVSRGLVLEAKRARAGRSLFLPGGWADLKAPALPVEASKLAADGLDPAALPFSVVLPVEPLGPRFARIWAAQK